MKYSIRGEIPTSEPSAIVNVIAAYDLWRLKTQEESGVFSFEAWVSGAGEKTSLFDDLKPYVDSLGGWIDWHECTHDESTPQPCVIAEVYGGA